MAIWGFGRPAQCLSGCRGTALLESQEPECARQTSQAHNRKPRLSSVRFPMRQRAGRQNGEKSSLCGGVNNRGTWKPPPVWSGIGTGSRPLSISTAALATSAHDESSGVAVCRRPLTHGCGQTVQESGQCHRSNLKLLMVAEQSFRRVKHPELMAEVYRGVEFVDGKQSKTGGGRLTLFRLFECVTPTLDLAFFRIGWFRDDSIVHSLL